MQEDPQHGIQEIGKTLELQPDHIPALSAWPYLNLNAIRRQRAQYGEKAVKWRLGISHSCNPGRVLREADD